MMSYSNVLTDDWHVMKLVNCIQPRISRHGTYEMQYLEKHG